ncbi:hypothetical protein [Flavobacterium sp.]|uniref:hypothetical protein n=1 Tax=Flavobacterium sp. TaxID=239 RepID=UPI003D09C49C
MLLLTNLAFTQSCNFDDLVRDLSSEGSSFKKIVEQENGFQAWRILAVEAPDFRTNLDEIDLVSKNLAAIKNAGGYSKWKNAIGAGNWITLENKLISKLSSTIDGTTLNKMIAQMKNAGDDGMKLALRIEKGNLESIDGYTSLIKNSSVDNHSIKAVNQALDKADNLVVNGKSKELLRFEDNPTGYEIDLGVKTSPNSSTYSEAYQFKTNTTYLSKSSIQGASSQLNNAPTTKRIIEFKLIDGDNINIIKNNEALKTEFKFQLYDKRLKPTNNIVIDEFHLLSNTGEKVRVVYQDGNLQFISF